MRAAVSLGLAETQQVRPGIWEDVITELPKLADIAQRTETFETEGNIIPTYKTSTTVSVLSYGPIKPDYSNLRYVLYAGERWIISSVVHAPPRLTIYIGEVYSGPTPSGAPGDPVGP
jgi:hypothetical protein